MKQLINWWFRNSVELLNDVGLLCAPVSPRKRRKGLPFKITYVQPVDILPHTDHCDVVMRYLIVWLIKSTTAMEIKLGALRSRKRKKISIVATSEIAASIAASKGTLRWFMYEYRRQSIRMWARGERGVFHNLSLVCNVKCNVTIIVQSSLS